MEPQEEIEAIERGTEVAAALAATGSVTGKLTAPQISSGGASAVDDFCRDGAKRCGCGAFISQGGGFLCLVPSIDVSNPKVVVGLGDSMTAATFFCELALRR